MAFGYLTPYRRGSLASRASLGGGSLFDLHRQMNSLFDDLFEQNGTATGPTAMMTQPMLDIHQDDDEIEITAELAGVKRDDIDITVNDGVLTICGEKKSRRDDDGNGYRERSYGRFERSVTLPQNVAEEEISADFEDGVLTISLPKSEEKTRGRRIELGSAKARSRENRAEDALIDQADQPSRQTEEKEQGESEYA